MQKIVFKDLMGKTIKELVQMRNDMKKALFDFKMKNAIRALKTTHHIKIAKRNVARINEALHHKIAK